MKPQNKHIPLGKIIKELRREMGMRLEIYPRLVASEKISEKTAQKRLDRLQAAINTLEDLKAEKTSEHFDFESFARLEASA